MPDSTAKVGGDFSGLIKGAEDAAKALAKIGAAVTGVTTLTKAFDVATGAIGGTVNMLAKVGQAALGIEAIGKSAVGMANGLLKGNAALEMTTISFKTLLGSAAAADDMIEQLTKFAASTPFQLAGLESQTQRLLAFGFSAKEIIPLMTSMGDAISALGGTQDNLNSLVYVMGQMRQEAHINAGDIMQMVNLGIPALQMLADHYHVTTGEIKEMISKGLIPGTDAVKIFSESLEKQYGGMMKAQSSTFSGMISNLQDWAEATTIILTKPLFEPAKKGLKALLDFVQSPAGDAAVQRLAGYIQKGVDLISASFVKSLPIIKEWFNNLEQTYNLIMAKYAPGVQGLSNQLEVLWTKIRPVVKAIWDFHQAINPLNIALDVLKGYLVGGIAGALDVLKERFSKIADYVKIGFDFAMKEAEKYGAALLSWAKGVGNSILSWAINTGVTIANKVVGWGEALIEWVAPYAVLLINELLKLGVRVVSWVVSYAPQLAKQILRWADLLSGWVIVAIPSLVKNLETMGKVIFDWGTTRLPEIMGNIVVAIGQGMGVNLRSAINDVLLVFNSLVVNIKQTVIPAFTQMVKFLSTNLMPLLNRLASFTATTLIPTLADLAAFTMNVLVPAFVRAADLAGLIFGPSLALIGSIIRNELLPALTDAWNFFDAKYMPTVRDLAAALGDKLAESIRIATDRFKDAAPKLDDFYKKIEPIVGKALELYKALSPISIALDVLKGLLTGGLQGGWEALEGHIVDAGKAFGLDLQPVIDWFNDTVVNHVIPTLKEWARIFIEEWWPKIRDAVIFVWNKLNDLWTFVSTKIWPPFKEFLDWLGEQWGKVGKSIGDTWEITIKPSLTKFFEYVSNTLWPKLRDEVFPWIETHVKPILEKAFDIIANHIIPDLGDFVDLILNHVIPALVGWWGVLFTLINPFLKTAGDLIGTIVGGLKDSKDPLKTTTNDFKNMADSFKKDVLPILEKVAGAFHALWLAMGGWLVEPVFKTIGALITLVSSLGEMLDKFSKGDYPGAVAAGLKAAAALGFKPVVINGNGTTPAQQRTDQYAATHPGYDPVAAGNAPKKATGDPSWRGGLVEIGEQGMELVKTISGKLLLATQPTVAYLEKGARIYNNRETMGMFKMPASPQQIHQMYQTNSNNYGGNSSTVNNNNFNLGVHTNQSAQVVGMSFGMMKARYGRS